MYASSKWKWGNSLGAISHLKLNQGASNGESSRIQLVPPAVLLVGFPGLKHRLQFMGPMKTGQGLPLENWRPATHADCAETLALLKWRLEWPTAREGRLSGLTMLTLSGSCQVRSWGGFPLTYHWAHFDSGCLNEACLLASLLEGPDAMSRPPSRPALAPKAFSPPPQKAQGPPPLPLTPLTGPSRKLLFPPCWWEQAPLTGSWHVAPNQRETEAPLVPGNISPGAINPVRNCRQAAQARKH